MEVRVSHEEMIKKRLNFVIDEHIGQTGVLKIIPSNEFVEIMEKSLNEIEKYSKLASSGSSAHYQLSKIAPRLYATVETGQEQVSQSIYQKFDPNNSSGHLQPTSSDSQVFDIVEYFSKISLDDRSTSSAWHKTIVMDSYLKRLQSNGMNIPLGWDMSELETPQNYPSRLVYESPSSITPFSIEQSDLPKISLLLPSSSPKVYLSFNREDQIQMNEIIRRNKEHVCISPLLHNTYLIDIQQLKELSIYPNVTYQYPNEFIIFDSGICYASANMGYSISEEKIFYRNRCLPLHMQRYKCQCPARQKLESSQILGTLESFGIGLEYSMMAATRGNLKVPKRAKRWAISLARNEKEAYSKNKTVKKLDADEIFPQNGDDDDSSSGSSVATKKSSMMGLNIYTRPQTSTNNGRRIPNVKEIVSDKRIIDPLNNLLNNMEEICKPQENNLYENKSLRASQLSVKMGINPSIELKATDTQQQKSVKDPDINPINKTNQSDNVGSVNFKFPLSSDNIPPQSETLTDNSQYLFVPKNLPMPMSQKEIQKQFTTPPAQLTSRQFLSPDPVHLPQPSRKRLFGSSENSTSDDENLVNVNNKYEDDSDKNSITPKKPKLVKSVSTPTSQQSDILKTLKHNKSSKSWYKNLPEHRKSARRAKDAGRKREANDPIAYFFKKMFQKMRDRCATIDLCIGYYMDNGVRKPRTKRTLHELYADRQREAELEDELRQHKDIIDILKKIYFKAKQPLRECINVGFSGADIVRCFFTRNDLTNREIYKLAVNNTNMSDNRKEFFIELIESERDWNDFFGVQYGYRIPWMEWIDSFEPSLEGLQVFDVLNNGKMLQSIEEEKLDNDVIWDPYSIEPLDNGMGELHPDKIAIQGHISDKITKSKKKKKNSSQLKFSQIVLDDSDDDNEEIDEKSTKKKVCVKMIPDSEEETLITQKMEENKTSLIFINDDEDENTTKEPMVQPVSRDFAISDYVVESFKKFNFNFSNKDFFDSSECGRRRLPKKELYRLAPKEWFSNFVVDEYCNMVQRRSDMIDLKCLTIGTIDSCATEKVKLVHSKYEKLITQKLRFIFAPLVYSNHFVLLILDLAKKTWTLYDPIKDGTTKSDPAVKQMIVNVKLIVQFLCLLYISTNINFNEWNEYIPEWAQQNYQKNGYDCGMFICQVMEQLSRGCKSVSILESDLARRLIASELLNGELYYENRELDVLSKTGSSYTNENGDEIVPSSLPFDSFYTNKNGDETVPSSLPLLDMENKETYSKGIAAISKSDDSFTVEDPSNSLVLKDDKTKTYEFNYKEIKEYCTQAKRTWNFEAKCQSQRKSSNCGKNDISRMELETLRSPMVPSSYIVRKYFELIIERSNGKCMLAEEWWSKERKFIEESGIEDNTEFPTFMDNADYMYAPFHPNTHGTHHFVLYIMNLKEKTFFLYDPYGNPKNSKNSQYRDASSTEKAIQNLKANIVTKIAKETGNKYTWTNWKETKPENLVAPVNFSVSLSGIYICQFAEQFSRNVLDIQMNHVPARKELMISELLNGELYDKSD